MADEAEAPARRERPPGHSEDCPNDRHLHFDDERGDDATLHHEDVNEMDVFVGSNDGRVYGLDLASGKTVWEYEAASPVTSSPAVAKGKVVVATADGQGHLLRIMPNANS